MCVAVCIAVDAHVDSRTRHVILLVRDSILHIQIYVYTFTRVKYACITMLRHFTLRTHSSTVQSPHHAASVLEKKIYSRVRIFKKRKWMNCVHTIGRKCSLISGQNSCSDQRISRHGKVGGNSGGNISRQQRDAHYQFSIKTLLSKSV